MVHATPSQPGIVPVQDTCLGSTLTGMITRLARPATSSHRWMWPCDRRLHKESVMQRSSGTCRRTVLYGDLSRTRDRLSEGLDRGDCERITLKVFRAVIEGSARSNGDEKSVHWSCSYCKSERSCICGAAGCRKLVMVVVGHLAGRR
jgi:hypothetical protein